MVQRILLVDYDRTWPAKYQQEAALVTDAFNEILVRIHHIGSTAIPEICAKPKIDILVEVTDIELVEERNPKMVKLGYETRGEFGILGRRYFSKKGGEGTYHVHTFQVGDSHIDDHLVFRDYLKARPELAQEYCRLKRKLAEKYPEDIESYTEGKSEFILEMIEQGREWRRS